MQHQVSIVIHPPGMPYGPSQMITVGSHFNVDKKIETDQTVIVGAAYYPESGSRDDGRKYRIKLTVEDITEE